LWWTLLLLLLLLLLLVAFRHKGSRLLLSPCS